MHGGENTHVPMCSWGSCAHECAASARASVSAAFTTIMAANHNRYKVEVHEANHPYAEHWIADLVDPTSADYHSARDLPAADLLVAGVVGIVAGQDAAPVGIVAGDD